VLRHPDFVNQTVTTKFIEDHPEALNPVFSQDRAQKLLHFLGNLIVNGPEDKGVQTGIEVAKEDVAAPTFGELEDTSPTLRSIYVEKGPEAFAKAVRDHDGLMVRSSLYTKTKFSALIVNIFRLWIQHGEMPINLCLLQE